MATIKCTSCGSTLVMNETWEHAFCENCGLKFTTDTVKRMAAEPAEPGEVNAAPDIGDLFG